MLRDLRMSSAKAVGELGAELRPVGIAHDDGRHGARPAKMIRIQEVEQSLDVRTLEAAPVALLVEVARRRADQYERLEPIRLGLRREHADHCADGMPNENGL